MSTNQDETLLERYQREEEVNKRLEQDAQAPIEEPELPEAAVNVSPCDPNNVYWNAGHPNDGVNSPLFTATQMHDHYQAGVRAGMGQSQNEALIRLLKEARKIVRASSSRNLVKDWDQRATAAVQGCQKLAKTQADQRFHARSPMV